MRKPVVQHLAYDVGYAKPPEATRFKAGRSGNPKGRPTGSTAKDGHVLNRKRLSAIILEEAYRKIDIKEQGGQFSITVAQAVVRSLVVRAARGDQRAQRLFTNLLTAVEHNQQLEQEDEKRERPLINRIERIIIWPDDNNENL